MEKTSTPVKLNFNLRKYFALCLRYWWLFVISVGLFVLAIGLYCYSRLTLYQVDAQVMLPPESNPTSFMAQMAQSFSFADFMGGSSTTDNEMDIMRSHSVLLNTVKELDLNNVVYEKQNPLRWAPCYQKPPIKLSTAAGVADTISASLIFTVTKKDDGGVKILVKKSRKTIAEIEDANLPANVETPFGNFTISPTEYYKYSKAHKFRATFCSYHAAAEGLSKVVKIFIPNKKTDFIGLSINTNEPKFGEKLLATIIDNYNMVGETQKNDNNNRTLEFVNNRLNSLSGELATSESSIEKFKSSNAITEPEADVQALLQKSTSIEGQLIGAQTENEILGITKSFISNPDNNYSLIPSLSVDGDASAQFATASKEINTYNGLILERMKLQNSAKGNNSALKAITDQIDALRDNIITSVDRAYNNSKVKLDEIKKESSSAQSRIGSYPTLEREFVNLKRVQTVQEQLYLFLLKQREEVEMSIARSNPTTVTIDAPHTLNETPGFSNIMMMLLAVMLGIVVPMVWLLLKRYNTTSITTPNEIESHVESPVAGLTGHIKGASKLIMDSKETLPANESTRETIRSLRHNVRHLLEENGGNTILVTSTHDKEGKTVTAVNLAAALALLDKRTLLVDADLRKPEVAKILNVTDDDGLKQYLEGSTAEPLTLTINLGNSRSMDVIAAGGTSSISAELLGHDSMKSLLQKAKEAYDYVVIDSTAVHRRSDTFELASEADLTLYVTRIGHTTGNDIDHINALYDMGTLPRIAIVVNNVRK